MRAILAALLLVGFLWAPANADVGNQWDILIKSQNEEWVPRGSRRHSTSLSGVVSTLASKAREIVAACGSKVISAVRHTRVRGSRAISLHASGRAVDMQGNPACMYAALRNWPGGVSADYHRVRHIHISYDPQGREWGLRFTHHGGKNKRYAKRGKRSRYAVAQ